jgi:hypothetical protein
LISVSSGQELFFALVIIATMLWPVTPSNSSMPLKTSAGRLFDFGESENGKGTTMTSYFLYREALLLGRSE